MTPFASEQSLQSTRLIQALVSMSRRNRAYKTTKLPVTVIVERRRVQFVCSNDKNAVLFPAFTTQYYYTTSKMLWELSLQPESQVEDINNVSCWLLVA